MERQTDRVQCLIRPNRKGSTINEANLKNDLFRSRGLEQIKKHVHYIHTYIHTYMKFITRCTVEDGSNQRRGLLLGGGV